MVLCYFLHSSFSSLTTILTFLSISFFFFFLFQSSHVFYFPFSLLVFPNRWGVSSFFVLSLLVVSYNVNVKVVFLQCTKNVKAVFFTECVTRLFPIAAEMLLIFILYGENLTPCYRHSSVKWCIKVPVFFIDILFFYIFFLFICCSWCTVKHNIHRCTWLTTIIYSRVWHWKQKKHLNGKTILKKINK